jgi:hypothetical protein
MASSFLDTREGCFFEHDLTSEQRGPAISTRPYLATETLSSLTELG